jgi:hypothetical protein
MVYLILAPEKPITDLLSMLQVVCNSPYNEWHKGPLVGSEQGDDVVHRPPDDELEVDRVEKCFIVSSSN